MNNNYQITEAKIKQFEDMIVNKLEPKYNAEVDKLQSLNKDYQDYVTLKGNIEPMLKDDSSSLNSLVNIGSECYMNAKTKNKRFFAEFQLKEGYDFVTNCIEEYKQKVEKQQVIVDRMKGDLISAVNALNQLKSFM